MNRAPCFGSWQTGFELGLGHGGIRMTREGTQSGPSFFQEGLRGEAEDVTPRSEAGSLRYVEMGVVVVMASLPF